MQRFLAFAAVWSLAWPLLAGAADAPCDPIVTFADGLRPVRERFVSPQGSDETGNGSRAAPFRSMGRAAQGLQAGDAIRLLPGTHSPGTYLGNLQGTAQAPIWLGGVPGEERPIIAGGSQAIHLSRVRYVVVEHLEVVGASQNGINCDDGGDYADPEATRFVVFRHLALREIGTGGNQDGLKLSGVRDYAVLDCEFARGSAGGSGIDHVGCHRGIIARCEFKEMGSNSIQCKGGSANIEIRANRFLNGGARAINVGGSTGFTFFRPPLSVGEPNAEARQIRVMGNLFRGSDTPVAFVGAVDSVAAHNTIIEPQRWILRILQETTSAGGYTFLACGQNRFANNLIWFDRARISTHVNIGGNTAPGTFAFSHNLWYAFNQPAQSQPSLPAAEPGAVVGRDPMFLDLAAADFRVATNSPAVRAGASPPEVPADLLGQCFDDPPTIGAFEAFPAVLPRADTDHDGLPDDWEQAHRLDPLDPTDAGLDADEDGLSNGAEYVAGTDPRDAESTLRLRGPERGSLGFAFVIPTTPGRLYRVEGRPFDLLAPWSERAVHWGTGGELAWGEVPALGGTVYRVRVEWTP